MADKRIPELDPKSTITGGMMFIMYDPLTDKSYRIELNQVIAGVNSNINAWQPDPATYNIDDLVLSEDRIWKSLINGNIDNPPAEDANWTEISKSPVGLALWQAGAYIEDDVTVTYLFKGLYTQFRLVTPTRPYISTNIEKEYVNGDWDVVSTSDIVGLHVVAHGIAEGDVITFKAGSWQKFAANDRALGVARSIVDADRYIIALFGKRMKGFAGLTTGALYYAQSDGTFGTTETPALLFFAISATEAIVFLAGGQSATPTYDPDAQAFFDALMVDNVSLGIDKKQAVNDLVTGLKGASLWTKFRAIYPFVGGVAAAHKYNLKDPRDLDAAFRLTFHNGVVHTNLGAYFQQPISSWADTHMNLATEFPVPAAHMAFYVREDQNGGTQMGATETSVNNNQWQAANRTPGSDNFAFMSPFIKQQAASAHGIGLNVVTSDGSVVDYYYRGTVLAMGANVGLGVGAPNMNLIIGGSNLNGIPSVFVTNTFCWASIGDDFDAMENTALNNIIEQFESALSRSV